MASFQMLRLGSGADGSIPLTAEEFREISQARESLFELLAIEEKFDLLLRNYVSFERALFDAAISNFVFHELSWSEFIDHIQAVNLPLMNLLGTCRTYVDHVPQHINTIFAGSTGQVEEFHECRKKQHSKNLGYRVLYEVRNHVQHSGLPVQAFGFNGRWNASRSACAHVAIPKIRTSDLASDRQFSKSVLEELQKLGDQVDLRPLVRENMSALACIHERVRAIVSPKAVESDRVVLQNRAKFAEACGDDLNGLAIVEIDQDENVLTQLSLFDDMIKRRKYLETQNMPIKNMEKHFVTNKVLR